MATSTPYKRAFLRSLYYQAGQAGQSLQAALMAATNARIDDTSEGKILDTTEALGIKSGYTIPAGGHNVSPRDIVELLSGLMDLYDRAVSVLTAPTDADIYTWMLNRLVPVKRCRPNFSVIRS